MIAVALCILALLTAYVAGRRSLTTGLGVVLTVGYFYGIVRANLVATASHFTFDAAVLGLYGACLFRRDASAAGVGSRALTFWVIALCVWPTFLLALPRQDPLVQLVGLRGSVFLVPFLFLGAHLSDERMARLAAWCAGLNIIAFGFAGAEFVIGLEPFFPRNAVTYIIYKSNDLIGYTQYRIPATFANAHAYGGTMVMTVPLLVGALAARPRTRRQKMWLVAGLLTALVGVFMSAARSHAAVLFLIGGVALFLIRMSLAMRGSLAMAILAVALVVGSDARLQRFTTMRDFGLVAERVSWSVNDNLLDFATRYVLGNGLGGGGTSMPYFLQDRVRDAVVMENEYARIMLEQGVPGVLLWLCFIGWVLTRGSIDARQRWYLGRRLCWCACASFFALGLIGTGVLTSVPQTALLLLGTGWLAVRPRASTVSDQELGDETPDAEHGELAVAV